MTLSSKCLAQGYAILVVKPWVLRWAAQELTPAPFARSHKSSLKQFESVMDFFRQDCGYFLSK